MVAAIAVVDGAARTESISMGRGSGVVIGFVFDVEASVGAGTILETSGFTFLDGSGNDVNANFRIDRR